MPRRHTRYFSAVLLCGAAFLVSCEELPTGPAETTRMRTRGVTLADWTPNGYRAGSASDAIADIAATGANTLVVIVTAYQDSPGSSTLARDPLRTPSEVSLRSALQRARAQGLRTVLKPHVDLNSGAWRGDISPSDPGAWFGAYRDFVVAMAALARSEDVDLFVVGTELEGTIEYADRWRSTIDAIRMIYDGELTYAASWDAAHRVPFWRDLDYVGVDFYAPVASRNEPGRLECLAGWQPWLDRLQRLHAQTGLRVLLTEVGYRSVDGAGRRPSEFATDGAYDGAEQADLYWAALEALGSRDWIEGVYWWNWLATGEGGTGDTDYTPSGKPAEGELQRAWNP